MIVSLSEWVSWLRTRPRFFKIFLLLILIKPVIDILWDIKIPAMPVTFLQIFGVSLAAITCASLLPRRPYRIEKETLSHLFFLIWIALQLMNEILVVVFNFSLEILGMSLKVAMPIYVYLLYRRYIFSRKDLDGILTTFYFSLIILVLNFVYHLLFTSGIVTSSRGLSRLETGYADIAGLGMAVNLSMLIVGYFLLQHSKNRLLYRRTIKLFYLNIAIGSLILLNIYHAASTIIFIVLLFLFWLYKPKQRMVFIFVLSIGLAYFIRTNVYEERFNKLYATDISVITGDKESYQAFHGRVGRWQDQFASFSQQSGLAQLVGLIGIDHPSFLGHHPHSDYLRILYSAGYIGLFFYLLFLFTIFKRSFSVNKEQKFLLHGVLLFLTMQSITLTPMTYHAVVFVFMATVAWLQLPKHNRELYFSPMPLKRKFI